MGNQFKLLKTLVKQGKVGVLCIHTISAKKHDIWLEGCCFLAKYHTFLPLKYATNMNFLTVTGAGF